MFGTKTDLIPQLDGYVPQRSAPINTWIFHKAVEHILAGLDQRGKSAILLIVIRIADSETRKQKKTLEDGKQPIGAVRFAKDSVSRSVIFTRERMKLMFCMAAVISEFLKNVLISERKGVILCVDMGLSMFLGGT